MSSFGVFARRVARIDPIEGADRIEVATVDGYQSIVPKGEFAVGDFALYIPEQALVPDPVLEELGLVGRLAGPNKNRVKAIRLRGVLSQGLLWRPRGFDSWTLVPDQDHAAEYGITKWLPEVPVHLAGEMTSAPELVPWIEIENIQKLREFDGENWIDPFVGRHITVTEKLHGTCFCLTSTPDGKLFVSSKGLASKHIAIREAETNAYWLAFRESGVDKLLEHLRVCLGRPHSDCTIAVYGEVFGGKIQDLKYGLKSPKLALFDVWLDGEWLKWDTLKGVADELNVLTVPVVYDGPYDHEKVWEMASGETLAGVAGSNMREGVVVRVTPEVFWGGSRLIAKFVSPQYLLRKEGTEYE